MVEEEEKINMAAQEHPLDQNHNFSDVDSVRQDNQVGYIQDEEDNQSLRQPRRARYTDLNEEAINAIAEDPECGSASQN